MSTQSCDILVRLNKEEIAELKQIYSQVKEADYVLTVLDLVYTCWEKLDGKTIVVTSPNKTWKQDGSIVVFLDIGVPAIFVYSFDKHYEHIREALLTTRQIDRNLHLYFCNVHAKDEGTILDIIKAMNRKIVIGHENYLYTMNIKKAKTLVIKYPHGILCNKLTEKQAEQINEVWPHKNEGSASIIAKWIELNEGYGFFKQEDNEMVAWVLQGPLGHINLLQTEEHYKRKGYGKLLTQIMAKHLAEKGDLPTATVIVTNEASVNLFNKLGFEIRGKSYFFLTEPLL